MTQARDTVEEAESSFSDVWPGCVCSCAMVQVIDTESALSVERGRSRGGGGPDFNFGRSQWSDQSLLSKSQKCQMDS